jgi:DNA-binding winged helix-turn-helix (wHTH) protein/tetratricopeptide (TPR) repeat protein
MPSYRFDRYELVPESRRLIHDGRDLAVGLRVFDIIAYLVEHRQRAVGRDELIAAVWGRSEAGEALLAQTVLKARRAFGDDGNAQHHIRTVPRFGYQWVAATHALESANADADIARADPTPSDVATETLHAPHAVAASDSVVASPTNPRATLSRRLPLALSIALALAVLIALALLLSGRHSQVTPQPSTTAPVAGLILMLPTQVRSSAAEDGWMRLGVMSLGAQALADVPGHAVVPDDTALAAFAHSANASDPARLRSETGASLVITSEASHVDGEWVLAATVFGPENNTQMVSAKASEPIVAAGALAKALHDLIAPGDASGEGEVLPPDVLALNARMKAAILEGQNGRALALYAAAPADVAAAPSAILLRAEALLQLGRFDEAAAALHALIDAAIASPAPRWLAAAWSALGDCELARGHPQLAEAHFRRSTELLGTSGDRRVSGLAWRGLGIAQVMRNDLDGSEASYLHARLELEAIGDRLLLARITDGLGYIAAHRGRMGDALLLYEQAAAVGAAFGLNETELGSRLNVAEAQQNLLHHTIALETIRALLPRIRTLDYPALHRFGIVAYAAALAETGALSASAQELDGLAAENRSDIEHDAVVDVRLDEARIRLAIGDVAGSLRQTESVRAQLDDSSPADLRLEAAALLLEAQMAGAASTTPALIDDAASWAPGNALAPAVVHALVARSKGWALRGDAALADAGFRQALAAARVFGAPAILRDVAVPYARFQLDRGQLADARATASVLGPYAEDDFSITLLLARLAVAEHDPAAAGSYFARAHALSGERWTAALAAEAAAGSR